MNNYVYYDIETYPNFFLVSFYDSIEGKFFNYGLGLAELKSLRELRIFLANLSDQSDVYLVGFNNKKFDDVLLSNFLNHYELIREGGACYGLDTPKGYHTMAVSLIQHGVEIPSWMEDNPYRAELLNYNIKTYDTAAMIAQRVSLKSCEIRVGHNNVQELPYSPMKNLTEEEMRHVMEYCHNDVKATCAAFQSLKKQTEIRDELYKKYKIWCGNLTDSQAGDRIMKREYSKDGYSGKGSSPFILTNVKDIIPNLKFEDKKIMSLYRKLCKSKLNPIDGKINYINSDGVATTSHLLHFDGIDLTFGLGGLHSINYQTYFEENDEYALQHVDVSSYYPTCIINRNINPEHLSKNWILCLKQLTEDRLKKKANGEKISAQAMKIIINSTFGKLGSDYGWQSYKKGLYSVTISCQLYLLKLMDMIKSKCNDFIFANVNTDGIAILINKKERDTLAEVCKEWEVKYNFELDCVEILRLLQEHVNKYVMLFKTGEIKQKGGIVDGRGDITIPRSESPIVGMVLSEYIKNTNLNIPDYVNSIDDMDAFLYETKSDKSFTVYYDEKIQQNINRIYHSTSGLGLTRQKDGCTISKCPECESISILNKTDNIHKIQDDLDRQWYIDRVVDFLKMVVDQEHLIESKKVSEQLRSYGLTPCEKPTGKKNPVGSTMGDIDYATSRIIKCCTGLGVVTGPKSKTIVIDIDNPELALKKGVYHNFKPTLIIAKDGDSYEDCVTGKCRAKFVYYCDVDNIVTSKNYLKSLGWEMMYGKDNPVVWGRHTSGRDYKLINPDGCDEHPVQKIPRKLLMKLIIDSEKQLITSETLDCEDIDEVLFDRLGIILNNEYGEWTETVNVGKNKRAKKFNRKCYEGECIGKHLHTSTDKCKSKIFLFDKNIYISCFHQSCLDYRKELQKEIANKLI